MAFWAQCWPEAASALVEDWHCFNKVLAGDLCHTAAASYDEGSKVSTVVNVPIVTLFFFLPFMGPPFTLLGIVAVAVTIAEVFCETESVGGDDDEELPSISQPPFILSLP